MHVNANVITVHLGQVESGAGIAELISELFLYYREGVEVEMPRRDAESAD